MKKFTYLILLIFIIGCNTNVNKEKNNDFFVEIFSDSDQKIVHVDSKIEIIADSLIVAEGPLWNKEMNSLLFTDVGANKIYKWNPESGLSDYMVPSGYTGYAPSFETGLIGANGLIYGNDGNLYLCQHGDRRVAKLINLEDGVPEFETVVDKYDGKFFNSPNDIIMDNNGDIYFTDPPYGFFNPQEGKFNNEFKELDFSGVYKFSNSGELTLISSDLSLPNGIALSNDEKYLFVNNSDDNNPVITRYDVGDNFSSELFFDGTELLKDYGGGFDGLKVHSSGNIFSTGPGGVLVISPDGELISRINFGGGVTNCNFDEDEQFLYVTGFGFVARVSLN
ncbi:MAG: SMP-30/gluconolactonase/LRE family protein [Flavobacteriaceae bacterium]|nr:SMP-30/gluconolactonase/LRE family protein [Flavobacteriaceae bacterium]